MVGGLFEEDADVRVMERVENLAALTLADDEPEMAEHPQLMGDGRLLHPDRRREFPYRAGTLAETSEDAHTAWRRQRLHGLSNLARSVGVDDDALCLVLDPVPRRHRLHAAVFIRAGLAA